MIANTIPSKLIIIKYYGLFILSPGGDFLLREPILVAQLGFPSASLRVNSPCSRLSPVTNVVGLGLEDDKNRFFALPVGVITARLVLFSCQSESLLARRYLLFAFWELFAHGSKSVDWRTRVLAKPKPHIIEISGYYVHVVHTTPIRLEEKSVTIFL
jgi:hypothetical protein